MYQPRYTLTNSLLANISAVERLYGQIEGLRIPKSLELNLTRKNMIKSSYASNRIEGNPLTLPEVTNLILDDRVPTNRDEKEVKNYFDILKDLEMYQERPLDIALVQEFHKRLMTGVDKSAGEIRNVMVIVGKYNNEGGDVSLKVKHNPPYHKKTEIISALKDLFSWTEEEKTLPTLISTALFHHQFVYLHPFEDGNGRVCRLLTAFLFLKSGYHINRYFVLDDYYDVDRSQYSDKLHSADTDEKTEWMEYFTDGVKYSLQSALVKFQTAIRSMSVPDRPSNREREVLDFIMETNEVTSQDISAKLKVSRQQAHALLRSLVEKGLLDKKGSTKSSFYFLKE